MPDKSEHIFAYYLFAHGSNNFQETLNLHRIEKYYLHKKINHLNSYVYVHFNPVCHGDWFVSCAFLWFYSWIFFNPLPDRVENIINFLCWGINTKTYKITEITVKNQVQLRHTEYWNHKIWSVFRAPGIGLTVKNSGILISTSNLDTMNIFKCIFPSFTDHKA